MLSLKIVLKKNLNRIIKQTKTIYLPKKYLKIEHQTEFFIDFKAYLNVFA